VGRVQLPGQHADEAQVTDELVIDRFEHHSEELALLVRFVELMSIPILRVQVIPQAHLRVPRCRAVLGERVQELVEADLLLGSGAEDRNDGPRVHRLRHRFFQLIDRQVPFGQVLFHHRLIALDDGIHEQRAHRLRIDRASLGHLRRRVEHADHALEIRPETIGDIEQDALLAERVLDGRDQLREVDVVRVALVDHDQPGQRVLSGLVEHASRIHLDAVHRRHDDHCRFDGVERFQRGPDKVGIARRIEQVDELSFVFEMQDRRVDREVVFVLLVVVVGDAGAVVHGPHAVHGVRLVEQGIGERGLPARPVPNQRNGANVALVILQHGLIPVGKEIGWNDQ